MDHEIATTLGQAFRLSGANPFIVCNGDGGAWLMTAAGGPRRLTSKEFDSALARVVEVLSAGREVKPPRIDDEFRRRFLAASGSTCNRSADKFAEPACPSCIEAASLEKFGVVFASR